MRNRFRLIIAPAVFALVALPMFVGFAGPDLASRNWNRVENSGWRLIHSIFSLQPAAAAEDDGPYAIYADAMKELKTEYFGESLTPKKSRELTYAAISGMLYSLNDPFTSFLDQDQWATMQQTTRGDFEGVGAELEQIGATGPIFVKRPIPETPAFRAGVKARDQIVEVGEWKSGTFDKWYPARDKSINDVVKMIKGPRGTKVSLKLLRKGVMKPIEVVIQRAHIEPPIVQYWMEDDQSKIGHIVLNEFNEKSDDQFDHAYAALMHQGMKALVFDLRYNPGGLLSVARDIGSRFVRSGPVVQIQEKSGQRQDLLALSQVTKVDIPLVLLVNENSASASEIVAGAIKDNGVGTVIGEHTFGKGLVQTLFPLSDGSALRLTTAKYFTSKGNDISNKYDDEHRPIFGTGGIKPDVVIKQSEDWPDQDFTDKVHDTQLQKALEVLRTKLTAAARR